MQRVERRVRRARRAPSTPTTRGRTPTPPPSTGCRCTQWLAGDRRDPQRASRPGGGQLGLSSRLLRAHVAAAPCSASARCTPEQGALRPTTSGRTCASPRARRPWRCGWPTELGDRIRLGSPVRLDQGRRRRLRGPASSRGEIVTAGAVVSAVPVGPLRDIAVEGVSDARLESLHRQRHALAAKFVAAYDTPVLARPRPERAHRVRGDPRLVLAAERGHPVLPGAARADRGVPLDRRRRSASEEALAELADWFGPTALAPVATFERLWGTDPWTQGYVTHWRPGDVHRRRARCTAPTSRRSTSAAPTSGWPATWRARCAPAAPPRAEALARG